MLPKVSRRIQLSDELKHLCRDWMCFFRMQSPIHSFAMPMRFRGSSAADAYASELEAGIGGWFSDSAEPLVSEVYWFALAFTRDDLKPYLQVPSSLQSIIAGL